MFAIDILQNFLMANFKLLLLFISICFNADQTFAQHVNLTDIREPMMTMTIDNGKPNVTIPVFIQYDGPAHSAGDVAIASFQMALDQLAISGIPSDFNLVLDIYNERVGFISFFKLYILNFIFS